MTTDTPPETPRRRRRTRLLAAILAAVLLAGTLLVFWPRFIPTAWIETAVHTVVARMLERPVAIGEVRVTRLGHIRLDEVTIWRDMDRTAPLVRWASFDLSVRLLPLLRGDLAVEEVTVIQPELFVPLTEDGRPALDLPVTSGTGALGLLIRQAEVRGGTVTLLNPDATPRLVLRQVDLTSRLESFQGPLRFRVGFTVSDANERATVGLDGMLTLAARADPLTWEALRGRVRLTVDGLDWEEAAAPEDLKAALAPLATGLLRQGTLQLTVARASDEAVDVEGTVAVGHLRWEGRGGEPVELTDAAIAVAGRYEVAGGAVGLERLQVSLPWLETDVQGRLEGLDAEPAFDGTIRGTLTLDGLTGRAREVLAAQGVEVAGPITWEAAVTTDAHQTAAAGVIELEGATVQVAGHPVKASGEPARVTFDLERAGERWTIHRIDLEAPEGETHVAGTVDWRPPQPPSMNLRVTSLAKADRLADRWYAFQPDASQAVTVAGDVTAQCTVRGFVGGLTLDGSLDATDALVVVDGTDVKARGEPATVEAVLDLKKQTLLIRQAEVRLPMATATLRGKLPLQATRPRYDLRANLHLDVDALQRRLGDELLGLPAGLTTAGSLQATVAVTRFEQTLGLDLDVDATALEVHWGLEGSKSAGVPARLRLVGRMERGVELDQLRVDLGPVAMRLAGRVAEDWATANLTYEGSVRDLATLPALWRPLTPHALGGGLAVRGILKWANGRPVLNGSADFQHAALTLTEPSVTVGLHGTVTHSPTSFFTERLVLTVDEQPLVVSATAERKSSGLRLLSTVEAEQVDLTNLWAHLPPPAEGEAPAWLAALAAAVGDGAQLYGRVQAAALTIAPYSLTDLVMEVTASDGAVQVPRLDFGLNGGTAHHTLTMDLTGPEPAVATTIDWRGLGADENLRPFFDLVFPNLFMTGTLDFSAQYQGTWADATRLTETLEGTSTMVVNGGYLVSDPTPESTREVFPTLTLSHYAFRRAHIETRTAAGISHNDMRFEAPTINLVMRGTTDNGTREINYVMVVDLVENLGLGGLREAISNKLQSASQVEIAYVTGTLDDQRIEFLRPKVVKIKEIMKSLVSLKPIRKFFMKMSAEEKGAYLQGKVGSFVGGALQPFRFLQEKLSQ